MRAKTAASAARRAAVCWKDGARCSFCRCEEQLCGECVCVIHTGSAAVALAVGTASYAPAQTHQLTSGYA